MAIQVSGTEVISNSRALNNIASVDATTAAAIGAAGVGGGGELEITASKATTLGDAVGVNSSGGVQPITALADIVQHRTTSGVLSFSNNNYGGDSSLTILNDDGSKVMSLYFQSGGNAINTLRLTAGVVNANRSVTWGSSNNIGGLGQNGHVDGVYIGNNKFAFFYSKFVSGWYGTYVRIAQITGTNTVSVGSEVTLATQTPGEPYINGGRIAAFSDGVFIVTYSQYNGQYAVGYAVCQASGTNVSYSTYSLGSLGTSYIPGVAIHPATQKFVIAWHDSNYHSRARVGTKSGTTLSYTDTNLNSNTDISGDDRNKVKWISSDTFVSRYINSGYRVAANNTVSTISISLAPGLGTYPTQRLAIVPNFDGFYLTETEDLVQVKYDRAANRLAQSGDNIALSTLNFNSQTGAPTGFSGGQVIGMYDGVTNGTSYVEFITANVGDFVNNSFLGIAKENISAGSTGKIAVAGGTVSGLSGYTAGTAFNVDVATGDFVEAQSSSVAQFLAVSSSELYVK